MKNEAMEDEGEKVNNEVWDHVLGWKETMQTHFRGRESVDL